MIKGYSLAIFSALTAAIYFIPYKAGIEIMSPQTFTFGLFVTSVFLNGVPFLWKRKGLTLNRATIISAIIFGVLSYTGNLFNGMSLEEVSPPITSVILRTQIFMIMFMGSFFLGEKLSGASIIGAIIAVIGVATMVLGGSELEIIKLQGIMYAVLAGLSFATVQIVNKYYISEIHPLSLNLLRILIALTISALFGGVSSELTTIGIKGWAYCFTAAAFGTTIARLASIKALLYIPVSQATIFSTLTPIFTTVLTLVLLGDAPSETEIVGGIIILTGLTVPLGKQMLKKRALKRMEEQ
ncbi:MAG: DMT family transporter [Bacteriovoracaceae bacterium]|nr:DMT family transporter [Bacteriovoracaceae bacterium]